MNAVDIVTIKAKIPLFKGEEQAERIELIHFEENGFEVVSQKDLYNIGHKAIYIQPDYCLSDIPLFEDFIRPINKKTELRDESSSMLGKVRGLPRRIRAKKFNFHTGNGNNVYSNGILLPLSVVNNYLDTIKWNIIDLNYEDALGITKYEAPDEKQQNGIKVGNSRPFPEGMYRTDEENINNLWNHLERVIKYPIQLVLSEKIDGSSISIYYKDNVGGICSRNLNKPLVITKITGRKTKTFLQKLLFWKTFDLNIYTKQINDDDFVKYGTPHLLKLEELCKQSKLNLVLRGELNGIGAKGSGNKYNPAAKREMNIKFYGLDIYKNQTIKLSQEEFEKVVKIEDRCKQIANQVFNSKEELVSLCDNYFKDNLIEGIVIRTLDHNFSAKYMNPEYDSKK